MKVLVIGGGAREHAILQALARSPERPMLLCAPGNPGIAEVAEVFPAVAAADVPALVELAREQQVDLVVVGPELPLVAGIADALDEVGIACFGPTRDAARLEGSKSFCKEVMEAAGVPTARYRVVTTVEDGMDALYEMQGNRYPGVIKADGLAAGKGVIIAADAAEARAALTSLLIEHRFGTDRVLVEEHLTGPEVSLLALCDGRIAVPLASAQDYKRIADGDRGPNTGGMGSYSPVRAIDAHEAAALVAQVHQPVLDDLGSRGIPFHGVLYAGVMLTPDGPKVLEFNTRFGDPETQAILPRLRSDLLGLLTAGAAGGSLGAGSGGLDMLAPLEWDPRSAVTVVLASAGYPESSRSGDVITGLEAAAARPDVFITHAGTALGPGGTVITAGGRVLSVTALGDDVPAARRAAYAAVAEIHFDGSQWRGDIGERVVQSYGIGMTSSRGRT